MLGAGCWALGGGRDAGGVRAIAATPQPPYTAVIFTSVRVDDAPGSDQAAGYQAAAENMGRLAAVQPGYLGMETARDELGITVSYWVDAAAAAAWKEVAAHRHVQRQGRERWYTAYRVRVARVERDYGTGPAPG